MWKKMSKSGENSKSGHPSQLEIVFSLVFYGMTAKPHTFELIFKNSSDY